MGYINEQPPVHSRKFHQRRKKQVRKIWKMTLISECVVAVLAFLLTIGISPGTFSELFGTRIKTPVRTEEPQYQETYYEDYGYRQEDTAEEPEVIEQTEPEEEQKEQLPDDEIKQEDDAEVPQEVMPEQPEPEMPEQEIVPQEPEESPQEPQEPALEPEEHASEHNDETGDHD